jgi:hypothetical protein
MASAPSFLRGQAAETTTMTVLGGHEEVRWLGRPAVAEMLYVCVLRRRLLERGRDRWARGGPVALQDALHRHQN